MCKKGQDASKVASGYNNSTVDSFKRVYPRNQHFLVYLSDSC